MRVNIRGEQVRFDKLALLGRNVLGGSVYLSNLDGRVWAVAEWPFRIDIFSPKHKSSTFRSVIQPCKWFLHDGTG